MSDRVVQDFLGTISQVSGSFGGSYHACHGGEGGLHGGDCREPTPFDAFGGTNSHDSNTSRCGCIARENGRNAERTGCSVGCSNSCFTSQTHVRPVLAEIQDLEHWLSCRNCELRNALEHGDVGTVARCGSLVAQGAVVFAILTQDVPTNARSSLM